MNYACILPVKNEENTIEKVINELSSKFSQDDNINFIIVSDSTDRTDEIIKNMNKPNISLLDGNNFGLGFSVLKGIKYALKFDPKYLFTIDTDGQVDLNEITLFLNESKKDETIDIFLSSRFLEKNLIDYKYPLINKFGTVILRNIINLFTNFKVTDSHGGIRLFKKKVAEKLNLLGDHTYVQEFLFDASENNFSLKELPSKWLKRNHGKSKVVGSIARYILSVGPILFVRLNLHKKIFYSLGVIFFFIFLFKIQKDFSTIYLLISMTSFISGFILESFKNIIILLKSIQLKKD